MAWLIVLLAADSGWNDLTLRSVFFHGLSDQLQDEFVNTNHETVSLDSLISLAVRLGNQLRECGREKNGPRQQSRALPPPMDRIAILQICELVSVGIRYLTMTITPRN